MNGGREIVRFREDDDFLFFIFNKLFWILKLRGHVAGDEEKRG